MGIKDLYKVIARHAPEQMHRAALADVARSVRRLAIDMSIYLYQAVRTAGPRAWVDVLLTLLVALKRLRIKAVCIFDGPHPPPEKRAEQEKRRLQTAAARRRLEVIRALRERVAAVPLDTLPGMKAEVRGALRRDPATDGVDYGSRDEVLRALDDKHAALERQTLPITPEYTERAIALVNALGLAALQSSGEAEKLCVYLAWRGDVDGVLTEDTDVLAYGCPLMLSKLDVGRGAVTVIAHDPLVAALGLTRDGFRDLCVLLGCDYNARAALVHPGGRKPTPIGAVRAYELVREHGALEPILPLLVDAAPLRVARCRALFAFDDATRREAEGAGGGAGGGAPVLPYNRPVDVEALRAILRAHDSRVDLAYVTGAAAPAPTVRVARAPIKDAGTGKK